MTTLQCEICDAHIFEQDAHKLPHITLCGRCYELHACESCYGIGTYDARDMAYRESNPEETCPDCDGRGYFLPNEQQSAACSVRCIGLVGPRKEVYE